MSRLSPADLERITGLRAAYAQRRWFERHYGAKLPYDRSGPIITAAAFEALVAKSCGLRVEPEHAPRPQVRLVRGRAAA